MSKLFFAVAFIFTHFSTHAQYLSHTIFDTVHQADTLVDRVTSTRFILDSSRIFIVAIDTNGRQLWKSDPWKDNKLKAYRVARPTIVIFHFAKNASTSFEEVIWIGYNNTQFGIVDKNTGEFTWLGQD